MKFFLDYFNENEKYFTRIERCCMKFDITPSARAIIQNPTETWSSGAITDGDIDKFYFLLEEREPTFFIPVLLIPLWKLKCSGHSPYFFFLTSPLIDISHERSTPFTFGLPFSSFVDLRSRGLNSEYDF